MRDEGPSSRVKTVHVAICTCMAVILLLATGRFLFAQDQTRCKDMLNDGWFLKEGYVDWQPAGCMEHTYQPEEIAQCVGHSRVLYVGDSIMREQFYSITNLSFPMEKEKVKNTDKLYSNPELGLTFEFWWDPYINSTRTRDMLAGKRAGDRPSLLVIGAGPWHMRHLKEKYFDEWKTSVERVLEAVQSTSIQVADAVLLSPVEIPQYNLLDEARGSTITADKITVMNDYLKEIEPTLKPVTPFAIPFAWNTIATSTVNVTNDGLHYLPGVTRPQAMLALNFRCNDVMSKVAAIDGTCCVNYPAPAWYQWVVLLFFVVWVPLGFVIPVSPFKMLRRVFPSNVSLLAALYVFGLGIAYIFFSDRTQLFAKAQQAFHWGVLTWWLLAMALPGVLTLRSKKEGDAGLLSRAQTEEWKGWMQIVILVYHFSGASQTADVLNVVPLLVAAYLFIAGYGHFHFFYKKQDFGIARFVHVLVRMNLLAFVLQYVMDTNYLTYYFPALLSFWFLVVWLTMYVGHSANTRAWFMLTKIAVMAILTGILIHVPGVMEGVFDGVAFLFNTRWNVIEWRERMIQTAWIVYVGMLFAFGHIKFTEHRWHEYRLWWAVRVASIVLSVGGLLGYFYHQFSPSDKQIYGGYEPFVAWIPILSFVTLRNATTRLRNTSSRFFEFMGRISLETFVGQYHMWLVADAKGLLVVLPNPLWMRGLGWWINLALSTVFLVFVSYHLYQTTGDIATWIISVTQSAAPSEPHFVRLAQNEHDQHVPLLPTTTSSSSSTDANQGGKSEAETVLVPETERLTHEDDNDDGTWTPSGPQPRWRRALAAFGDLRVMTGLFFLVVGIFNHFC